MPREHRNAVIDHGELNLSRPYDENEIRLFGRRNNRKPGGTVRYSSDRSPSSFQVTLDFIYDFCRRRAHRVTAIDRLDNIQNAGVSIKRRVRSEA
ncbi:MAG: hypothetical protein ED559_06935 [Phycisphaera sp.]|nr:MAG: hypothetical protein ED559_06935 [Phycisphaera sp.]